MSVITRKEFVRILETIILQKYNYLEDGYQYTRLYDEFDRESGGMYIGLACKKESNPSDAKALLNAIVPKEYLRAIKILPQDGNKIKNCVVNQHSFNDYFEILDSSKFRDKIVENLFRNLIDEGDYPYE